VIPQIAAHCTKIDLIYSAILEMSRHCNCANSLSPNLNIQFIAMLRACA